MLTSPPCGCCRISDRRPTSSPLRGGPRCSRCLLLTPCLHLLACSHHISAGQRSTIAACARFVHVKSGDRCCPKRLRHHHVREASMHRRTAVTTSPGVTGLCSTHAAFKWGSGSRLSVRMMTGRCPGAGARGNLLTDRGAIDVREDEVEDDGVEGAALENRQRLDAVPCFTGRIPVKGQRNGKQPPEIVVDFDEEDGAWGAGTVPATCADVFRGLGARARGRRGTSHRPSTPAGMVAPAELVDILPEGSDLLGEVPQPRIDFVFQSHQKRRTRLQPIHISQGRSLLCMIHAVIKALRLGLGTRGSGLGARGLGAPGLGARGSGLGLETRGSSGLRHSDGSHLNPRAVPTRRPGRQHAIAR